MINKFYLTAEIRWFGKGNVPEELRAHLFEHYEGHTFEESRTDTYLVFPTSESVGVKFREGAFEVKSFVRKIGKLSLHPNVESVAEIWEKWTLNNPVVGSLKRFVTQNYKTIDVAKTRWVQILEWENGKIAQLRHSVIPHRGCQVEVSEIGIKNDTNWSFSFEAFGGDDLLETILGEAFKTVNFNDNFQALVSAGCFDQCEALSYPSWLSKYSDI